MCIRDRYQRRVRGTEIEKMVLLRVTCAALLLVLMTPGTDGKSVTFSNVLPRYNVTGEIMDAHDGSYNQWTPGGPWYYYAMGYGECKQGQDMCHDCGYGYSWIGVWKSPDLSNGSWTLVRDAREVRGKGGWPEVIYFRVHVVFNRITSQYVLWVNLNGGTADYAVGFSSSPEGPFKFSHLTNVSQPGGGDFDILVDDDDRAYIIYTSTTVNHTMQVEMLSREYGHSLAPQQTPSHASNFTSGVFGSVFVEAPAMFKRRGVYYALFDNCCCFCGGGSGAGVYTASNPLGPWLYHQNIACGADVLQPGCGCGMNHDSCPAEYNTSITKAQQNFVIKVGTGSETQYIWTGDQWESAADGIKAHDLQYWAVLSFATDATGIEVPTKLDWQDEINFQVTTNEIDAIKS
eukprot:TRINITY_DN16795_c0_g1_i1.p1 TRINITY_DN16795_c0_g1~~TRINITY_DN16795_c0_g1_i1.p1  ORF type:complete len:403 (-),score=80.30 TRINITY_DN16795_c0_g1_i1:31-1239(-)